MLQLRTLFSLTLLILSVGIINATVSVIPVKEDACPIRFKCSTVEDVVWATDDRNCFVFLNECHLNNENCQRLNRQAEALKMVSKEECQKLCRDICPDIYSPVCAEYNGIERKFENQCALTNHMCHSGEPYGLPRPGECE